MNSMEKIVSGVVLFIIMFFASLFLVGCETVEPGYIGLKVNYWGSERGVDSMPIVTGRILYNRLTTKIYEFPTFRQNVVWTKAIDEGSPADESISFNSIEGEMLNADIACSYTMGHDSIVKIFQEIRQDATYITHVYMRMQVRDVVTRHAGKYKAIELIGEKREAFLKECLTDINSSLKDKGIIVDTLAFVGEIRVSERVKSAISATIESSQRAIEAENKVKQKEAEAAQAVAEAKGVAESRILAAEAEAKATLTKAKAEAEANELLTKSMTPELLQYRAMDKWDGKLPTVSGTNAVPFINVK